MLQTNTNESSYWMFNNRDIFKKDYWTVNQSNNYNNEETYKDLLLNKTSRIPDEVVNQIAENKTWKRKEKNRWSAKRSRDKVKNEIINWREINAKLENEIIEWKNEILQKNSVIDWLKQTLHSRDNPEKLSPQRSRFDMDFKEKQTNINKLSIAESGLINDPFLDINNASLELFPEQDHNYFFSDTSLFSTPTNSFNSKKICLYSSAWMIICIIGISIISPSLTIESNIKTSRVLSRADTLSNTTINRQFGSINTFEPSEFLQKALNGKCLDIPSLELSVVQKWHQENTTNIVPISFFNQTLDYNSSSVSYINIREITIIDDMYKKSENVPEKDKLLLRKVYKNANDSMTKIMLKEDQPWVVFVTLPLNNSITYEWGCKVLKLNQNIS